MNNVFLKQPLVSVKTAISRSTMYKLIAQNKFPRPSKLGRSSLWLESEVDAWIESRVKERDATLGTEKNGEAHD